MRTIEGVIYGGQIHPSEPLDAHEHTRCVITIFEETTDDLRAQAQASLEPEKQTRLNSLLATNKKGLITPEEERELDNILAQVYELAAKKARASRLLRQFELS